eukprot:gene19541-50744_t
MRTPDQCHVTEDFVRSRRSMYAPSCPKSGVRKSSVPAWPAGWSEKQPSTVAGLQSAAVRLVDQALAPYLILAGPS